MNGSMFDELRKLVEEPDELPQDVANRMTLSALAEISNKLNGHILIEEQRNEGVLNLKNSVDDLSEAVALLSQSVVELKKEIDGMKNNVDAINENLFVALGRYIKTKPKQSILYGLGIFVGVYLILGFRILSIIVVLVGSLFGVPQETLEWVLQWMGQ